MEDSVINNEYKTMEKQFKRKSLQEIKDIYSEIIIDTKEPYSTLLSCVGEWKRKDGKIQPIWNVNQGQDGFYIIPLALSEKEQVEIGKEAITTWSTVPHVTNISNHSTLNQTNQATKLPKLSWSTLGRHYDWTKRMYHDKESILYPPSSLPLRMIELAMSISSSIHCPMIPTAGIVNYYTPSSIMGGHFDDAEINQNAPVISISLGQSALFLKGGLSKSIVPIPVILHSGDIIILAKNTRRCIHGVPRIFSHSFDDQNEDDRDDDDDIMTYLKSHRININLRQVDH